MNAVGREAMKMRFFTIPIQDSGNVTGELNGFLSNHRVLTIERHFVADGGNSAWAICVNYLDSPERVTGDKRGGGGRIDYREVLNDSDFAVFAKLRSLRKTLAERDGVPAYALFTNEQLADMVRKKVASLNALEQISGVGPARTKKYGAAFLEILKAHIPAVAIEANGESPS
jgi:superfamily II DNA helicase RecQ